MQRGYADETQEAQPVTNESQTLIYTKTVKADTKPAEPTKDHILPLEITLNGAKSGTWLLLERDGAIYAPQDALEEWRVQLPPEVKPIDFKLLDQPYFPLAAIPGYKFKIDYASQSAELFFSPEVFAATRLEQETSKLPQPSPVLPSMFLNYDLNYTTSQVRNSPNTNNLGLLTEIGGSNSLGVFTSSQGHDLNNYATSTYKQGWVRLETTFTRDYPAQNRTLRLGDSMTRTGMWGRNVYFGGVQYGTNFALTPGFVSQPLPVLTGISTAPSTVEMYVNDVLRQVSSVPAGPFAVDNFPLLTGNGDVRMVVKDVLGRETVIEQSFFISTQLLAKGLDDWSIEAGSVRRDMGIASNHYGPVFASGTWRHGYSNDLTLEGRAEATSQMLDIGFGMASVLPKQVLGKAALAISSGNGMNGEFWLLGLEQQKLKNSLSFQIQGATSGFHQLGQADTTYPIKLQVAGNWSYATEHTGTFGIGMASLHLFDGNNVSTLSGNYSTRIGDRSNLNFTLSHATGGTRGTSIGAFLVVPLDNNRVASASANIHDGQQDIYLAESQNPTQDNDLGWRALAGRLLNQAHAEGGVYYTGRYGKLSGDASTSPDQTTLRLDANGGLVVAERKLFVTQRVDQSFAVAEVKGYKNIGVGLGGNMLTMTDKDGMALIPRLIPYQSNSIRLNPSDLPISAEIDTIEQTAIPSWRSAVKVVFPVRGGRGALLKIQLENGEVAPAGAIVSIEGDKEEFYVARRGEAFVTGLGPHNVLLLKWNGQQCKLEAGMPEDTSDEIPHIGPLLCKGVQP